MFFYRAKAEAAEKLRLSEERYRTLAQNLPESALLLYDQDLRFLIADGPEIEATGFSRERLEGKTLHEALPAEFAKLVEPNMRRALGGEEFSLELPYADRFYRYSYVPLRDTSGHVVMAMILATNVTQLRQTEDALRISQRRLGTALRVTKIGAWEWDMRTNNAYWSDENYRVLGLDPGSIESKYENWAKCLHPEDLPAAEVELAEAINRKSELNIEFRVVWPDGSIHWINDIGSMLLDETGQPLSMYGIQMDITERKQAEEALRQAQLVLESSPVILFRWKAAPGWPVELVSENITQFGYTPEEFLSGAVPYASLVHPDDLQRITREVSEYSTDGVDRFQQEYRILTKDGQIRWTDDQTVIERNAMGVITHYQGVVMDVTERKRAEESQRAAEARYRALVEQIPATTYIDQDDGSGHASFVSPQIQSLLGISPEDWRQADADEWGRMIHPEDSPRVLAAYRRALETGQPFNEEYRIFRPDGRLVWIEDHAIRLDDASGQPVRMHGVMFDVTERKRADKSQRTAEARYRALVEQIPATTYIDQADGSGRSSFISPQIQSMLGVSPEDWRQADAAEWDRMIHPEDSPRVLAAYRRVVETGQPFNEEYRIFRPDGRLVWIDDHAIRLDDASGQPSGIHGVMFDITVRKQAEEELLRQTTLFRNLFESSPEAIAVVDQEDRVLEVNRSFETLYGYLEAEAQGHYINDLLAPEPYSGRGLAKYPDILGNRQFMERRLSAARRTDVRWMCP